MYLAIDIGATKTLIALFSNHGRCLKKTKFLTNHNQNFFLLELLSNLKDYENKNLKSIVIAVPAIVQKNYAFKPDNLPWENLDLYNPIKKIFKTSDIHILNDADLATLYESGSYSGKTVYLTFSTGIGGGIAKDGVVQKSSSTFEPGHKKYFFSEKEQEWEDIASAKTLKTIFKKNLTKISDQSDFETIAFRISIGLIPIINQYHPNTIIFGGPIGKIFPKIRPFLKNYLNYKISPMPKLVQAKKPEESVIYGCYLYAKFH